ncbi:glycerol-3-phosphate acyltransferase 1, mitochondrial-like [Mya arenaria]|uniref:glycerol-3-phosphate acyltransferase 1, mitochondrial-like n=1 Tax=Mya arenaria TaxID=6604 RepID=UPI0022E6BEB8|nr:glycerol-3-phosphate acyltransferase 1, mitochondrial-like [Mya arenaria]XP_052771965.1 glycerol-3-phosphate acyltransferase 1, mitochondrial-like [Mya arenaria]
MPVSILPSLDPVFAKWEGRGPTGVGSKGHYSSMPAQEGGGPKGKQRWRERFGDNIQQVRQRRGRDRPPRIAALSSDLVQINTIAQFKMAPTVSPEQFLTCRPLMGTVCHCMPNSQKDLVSSSTSTEGMRNILDVRHELRGSGGLSRQFSTLVYTWRLRCQHRFPDLSMATLTSQRVVDAIHAELLAEEVRVDQAQLEKRAKKILRVMASSVSNTLTKLTTWTLHHILNGLLGAIYVHRGQMAMVKTASQRGVPLLFLPLHKSHLDYILITFILANYEIKNPNIAAGDNLDIPFFSWLMRGLGGYFIRRKLDRDGGKDMLYRSVLHSYMEQLLCYGEFLEFFLEGGRSRTGRPLLPKGGLLSVIVDCLKNGIVEDVYVVPVSISYEKLLDGNYNNEQMGVQKKRESFLGAVKAIWLALRCYFGNVRVDFAQPFSLKECMESCSRASSPREGVSGEGSAPASPLSTSPRSLFPSASTMSLYGTDVAIEDERQLINNIGSHVVHTCTRSLAVMSTHLVAFMFLTSNRQGGSVSELSGRLTWLRGEILLRGRDLGFAGSTPSKDILLYASKLLGEHLVSEKKDEKNEEDKLIPCVDMPYVFEMSYYANQVISVFLLESILVSAVLYLGDVDLACLDNPAPSEPVLMTREDIRQAATHICKLLSHEFIYVPPCKTLEEALSDTLDSLITSEILKSHETQVVSSYENVYDRKWASRLSDSLSWAEEGEHVYTDEEFVVNIEREDCRERIRFLHSVLAPILESYLVTAHHCQKVENSQMPEEDFLKSLHNEAKTRVQDGVASYSESAGLSTLKTSVKAFKSLQVLSVFSAGNVSVISMSDNEEAADILAEYMHILQALR